MRENSEKFDWPGVEFPASWKDIDIFEKHNPYAINVFGYDDAKGTYTRRISKKYDTSLLDDPRVINLLLISNGETNHYCWIKNMSKLLSSKINNNQHKRHFCLRCLNSFNSKCSLIKHLEYCSNHEAVKIEMPKDKNKCIYFKNFGRKMRKPFVVYADFECYNEKMESGRKLDPEKSYNEKYQKHTPSGFGYLIKCFDNKLIHLSLYNIQPNHQTMM